MNNNNLEVNVNEKRKELKGGHANLRKRRKAELKAK